MTRPPALLAASAALAALALVGCSGSSSPSSTSGTSTGSSVAPTTATSSPDISASASSLASSAAGRLQAIRDCLQKANLPTPTSTDAAGLLQELPKLIQSAPVRQALQQCNIPLPG